MRSLRVEVLFRTKLAPSKLTLSAAAMLGRVTTGFGFGAGLGFAGAGAGGGGGGGAGATTGAGLGAGLGAGAQATRARIDIVARVRQVLCMEPRFLFVSGLEAPLSAQGGASIKPHEGAQPRSGPIRTEMMK